jgi:uncharacterized protein with WD repeat
MRLSALKASLPKRRQRLVVGVVCLCLGFPGISPLRAEEAKARTTLQGHTHAVTSVVFSPDGKTLASGSCDDTIKLWDVATAKNTATLHGHTDGVNSVAFSPGGKALVSASNDNTVKLWDVATGKNIVTLKGHTSSVEFVAFSPNGKSLASASADHTIKLWDIATGKNTATLHGHTFCVHCVIFSPDGKTLASGSLDSTLKLWDVTEARNTFTLRGHQMPVHSVNFSPNGKMLASGSTDGTVRLWEVATGKQRAILYLDGVFSVTFSPNGKNLAFGGDKTIKVWDIASGEERATFQRHKRSVYSLAFSPDGKTLASGSSDETIKLWELPTTQQAKPDFSRILSRNDQDVLWTGLADADAAKAYDAMKTLLVASEQAVILFRDRLQPVPQLNGQQIAAWIVDLDSNQLAVREKAREGLENAGEAAVPALQKKLTEKPPLEVRQRIERLLARLDPEWWRTLRAIEVLEHIGTPEAKQVLETLATGAEGARLTKEANASLERLKKRVDREVSESFRSGDQR